MNLNLANDEIIDILLKDRTTGKNIIWATDDYSSFDATCEFGSPILPYHVLLSDANAIIRPRSKKTRHEQNLRIKDKAEVFTPSWICNKQNNLVDADWFGKNNVFNYEDNTSWFTNEENVEFPDGKTWMQYVCLLRMEITCGEAPYLVSPYDSISGENIQIEKRVGLLDRKLRVVTENTSDDEWQCWVERAYMSIYGYEYQGDNLFLARGNLLQTYLDYYIKKFKSNPSHANIARIADIISWNIWQMDGLTCTVPYRIERSNEGSQVSIFGNDSCDTSLSDIFEDGFVDSHSGTKKNSSGSKFSETYCKIMDWQKNKAVSYVSLMKI